MAKSVNTADEYEFVDHEETALSLDDLNKVRDWLQPTDYLAESGEFRRHLLSQAPGTGLWICETEEYRKWHDSPDHGSLWIKGVPGAGKSVTAASIIQHLRTTEDCPVLFFFFRNIVAANYSPRALIQDWLAQLLPHSPKLQVALHARLASGSVSEISDANLIQLFLDGISCVPKLYCVADALDETTTDNRAFLDHLNGLAVYRPRSLKLLITSRPKQHLQSALRDSSIVHISLQQKLVDRDILSYLNQRFDQVLGGQQLNQPQIIDMVARRSEGLFLYAKLTMDQVESALASNKEITVEELERSLPVGLEQTYDSLLKKQREEHNISVDTQVLILEAVTHASRPLRLNELASFVQRVSPGAVALKGYKSLVATSCGPLIEILEDETLQVIHHSFTEFLRGDTRNVAPEVSSTQFPIIDSSLAHKKMAVNCLRYLQSGSLQHESDSDASVTFSKPAHQIDVDEEHYKRSRLGLKEEKDAFDYQEARLLYSFLQYAVENWFYHASRYDVRDEEFFTAILDFLDPDSIAFRRWLVLQWGSTSMQRDSTEGLPTPLHIAAFSGLSEFAVNILEQGASVSCIDAHDRIPLHWAASNGHTEVASLLIEKGSNPNAEDGAGLKPIHFAARKNHASIVTMLLQAGVEPDTKKTKENRKGRLMGGETITRGECAILYASRGGHTETVIAMIPFCKGEVLERLLCECCRYDLTDAVLAILDKTDVLADATFADATALYFACLSANVKCVKALVKRGADVSKLSTWLPRRSTNGGGWDRERETAPLHRLVRSWKKENDTACRAILRLLLDAGADLEQLSGAGNTPLLLAAGGAENNYRSSIKAPAVPALLEAGADVNKQSRGYSPLHLVLGLERNLDMVRLLVEYGCDPNIRDDRGVTPIHCCVNQTGMIRGVENTASIIQYLLDQGADPNLKDDYKHSAIFAAMSEGTEVFRLLLSRCTDESIKKQCWFRLPSVSDTRKFSVFLDILLAEGIDIDMVSQSGRPLYLLCMESEEKLQILREKGAETNVVDSSGNNALHILASSGNIQQQQMEKRIADGVDPLSTNFNGETLLHHIVRRRNYKIEEKWAEYVKWLIGLGISVNAVDKDGRTILHEHLVYTPKCDSLRTPERLHFMDVINFRNEVDFEIRDNDGMSPIHIVARLSEIELANLVDAGADPECLTKGSQNILHLASCARKPGLVGQILDQYGISDIDQRDSLGRTALHYACSAGDIESVAFLLQHGAGVSILDREKQTPLHASANFRAEQDIWDARGQQYKSVIPLQRDPFRSGSLASSYSRDPWYKDRWGSPRTKVRKTYFPAVSHIVQMLLHEGADPGAMDGDDLTALDIALRSGCSEFTEPFFLDENLFARTTKNLEEEAGEDEEALKHVAKVRQRMRAQMALMRPRSSSHLDTSEFGEAGLPGLWHIDLLPPSDAAELANKAFDADTTAPSNYANLESLMKPGHLQVLEKASRLAVHYSSYDVVEKILGMFRSLEERRYHTTVMTALQLACDTKKPNMMTLKYLVEKLHVDVNATCAALDGDAYRRDAKPVSGGTALHFLASADNWWKIEAIRYLLENGADANAVDEKGQTPLHIAASGRQEERNGEVQGFWKPDVVRILIDHGADLNVLDKTGVLPLHNACNAPDVLKTLLQNGAVTTLGARSPLFQAIFVQNLLSLEMLLDSGISVDLVDEKYPSRRIHYSLTEPRLVCPALASAFAEQMNTQVSNSAPLLRALIERGANIYLPLNEEETLIHFLFQFPEYEVLDTLLQEPCASRIDFNRRDQRGRTVLMAACAWHEVLPGYSHRHWSAKAVGPPIRILDLHGDPNLVDNEGKIALHHLLDNPGMPDDVLLQFISRPEVAPTLLVKDNDGFSPLHYALHILRPDVCQLLISLGASILEPDPNGLTALHHIATHWYQTHRRPGKAGRLNIDLPEDHLEKCLALWQRFLAEGGSINCRDNVGNTPMHMFLLSEKRIARNEEEIDCCHGKYFEGIFSDDSGADVHAVNNEGETMLHMVSRRNGYWNGDNHDVPLFKSLMSKGLDPLKEDAKARSALDVASVYEKEEIVAIFGRK